MVSVAVVRAVCGEQSGLGEVLGNVVVCDQLLGAGDGDLRDLGARERVLGSELLHCLDGRLGKNVAGKALHADIHDLVLLAQGTGEPCQIRLATEDLEKTKLAFQNTLRSGKTFPRQTGRNDSTI